MHAHQATHPAPHPARHAQRQLLDGVDRIVRAPKAHALGWALLALHLSRIPAPGPKAHHRRIAAAILDDVATRTEGQLFQLASGDLALLFRPGGSTLDATLARLFQTHLGQGAAPASGLDAIRTLFPLPAQAGPARTLIQAQPPEPPVPGAPEPRATPAAIAAMDTIVQTGALADLMHRQTAIRLHPGTTRLEPLFREIAISTTVLEARIAAATPHHHAAADPFLFNHLAARLDRRMLHELARDIPQAGPLSAGLPAPLHVNLTLAGILSPAFATLADAAAPAKGLSFGIEIPFAEAFADVTTFILARERLRLAGMAPILDGVSHHALLLTDLAALQPTLLKLDWCPTMPDAPALPAALARLGPHRIVLHRAQTEAALAWGLRHGIQRFQGRYVDAMLAAARMQACPHATACRLRQCQERASATGPAGRAFCHAPALLDHAAPPPARQAA